MHLYKYTFTICFLFVFSLGFSQEIDLEVIPLPKEISLGKEKLCVDKDLSFYANEPELSRLYDVFQEDFFTMTGKQVSKSRNKSSSTFSLAIDNAMNEEQYRIDIGKNIQITGGSYDAVAMGSVTVLQGMTIGDTSICWNVGYIQDFPDFNFRGVLLDVARQKHDIATIKNIIMLCRWYKVNYLQLHLTDNRAFTFPSKAFPQLPTENWVYSREELADLVTFAEDRGVEIIPELEVPGHAGQLIEKMPRVFGFENEQLNRSTANMSKKRAYSVLDTLFREVAEVFHTSEFIHIGGDEADFRGMEEDSEIKTFLQKQGLKNIHELYWQFINKMHESVKKAGKKTIVWEGFSKEGNEVVDKDIIVMAWETLYQLPQDILESGYTTINVSWEPLYVVNKRKWAPEEIFNWNIYRWDNFYPVAPSFETIQLDAHPKIIGSMMASWEQPAFVELSSLRKRIPAMIEEPWNHSKKAEYTTFAKNLEKTDQRLNSFLTPIQIKVDGLTRPTMKDGRYNEQTWFQDHITVILSENRNLDIRFSVDSSTVTKLSTKHDQPISLNKSTELRYRAFKNGHPVGVEMLEYFELRPLKIDLAGEFPVPLDSLWDKIGGETIKYIGSVKVDISSEMKGTIRYILGDKELSAGSTVYTSPLIIKDDGILKTGLFVNGKLVGSPWIQEFKKE